MKKAKEFYEKHKDYIIVLGSCFVVGFCGGHIMYHLGKSDGYRKGFENGVFKMKVYDDEMMRDLGVYRRERF